MALDPTDPHRPPQPRSPPSSDPYCLFKDDVQRRLALRFREGARTVCLLVVAILAMCLHPDPRLLWGGIVGAIYKLFWRQ